MKFKFLDKVTIKQEFYSSCGPLFVVVGHRYEDRIHYYQLATPYGPSSTNDFLKREIFRESDLDGLKAPTESTDVL